jgi:hypothetical protein
MGSNSRWYALSISIVDSDAWDNIEKVAELVTKGLTPYQIARRLNIKVIEAKSAISQWHEMLARDMDAKDAARDYLNQMVAHYDFLIAASRENLEKLEGLVYDEKISGQVNATIKTIGDLEKTRAAALKEAGLLDVGELGDELAERARSSFSIFYKMTFVQHVRLLSGTRSLN